MNNLPTTPSITQLQAEAKSKTDEQLLEELSQNLNVTAEYLMRSAVLWQELELRGHDLSHLRNGIMSYLPMIATQQLDARAVVRFAGQKTLLAQVSKLPPNAQKKLLDDDNIVQLVTLAEDNTQIIQTVDISKLPAGDIHKVIGDGQIKTPEEQYQALLVQKAVRKKQKPAKSYRMTSNIVLDGDVVVIAGKHGVNIDKLKALLSDKQ